MAIYCLELGSAVMAGGNTYPAAAADVLMNDNRRQLLLDAYGYTCLARNARTAAQTASGFLDCLLESKPLLKHLEVYPFVRRKPYDIGFMFIICILQLGNIGSFVFLFSACLDVQTLEVSLDGFGRFLSLPHGIYHKADSSDIAADKDPIFAITLEGKGIDGQSAIFIQKTFFLENILVWYLPDSNDKYIAMHGDRIIDVENGIESALFVEDTGAFRRYDAGKLSFFTQYLVYPAGINDPDTFFPCALDFLMIGRNAVLGFLVFAFEGNYSNIASQSPWLIAPHRRQRCRRL